MKLCERVIETEKERQAETHRGRERDRNGEKETVIKIYIVRSVR